MKPIFLTSILFIFCNLFIGCQSADLDEEGWVESGFIAPPVAQGEKQDKEKEDIPVVQEKEDIPVVQEKEDIAVVQEKKETNENQTVALQEPVKKPTPIPIKRLLSSKEPIRGFKSGFNIFSKNCQMKKNAENNSDKVGLVKKGKKLWVDKHDDQWGKVYRKNGHAFISLNCIN